MTAAGERRRVLAARYELLERLGTGGAGTVWHGHDRALDRPVAVKLLHTDLAEDPAAATRFRTEATAAAKLTHPHAVLVYDLGRDGEDDYLVMEFVNGVNLADVLLDGPLPPGVAADLCAQVASALGVAHQAGIVHRDVKPGNVLVTNDGAAKLADFGIARALGAVSARLTRTGMVLGTARYLAPEQLRDEAVDARADVYALGLVLYELLTGRPPFGEGSAIEVAARRLTTPLPRVPTRPGHVPPGLEEVMVWATRVEPGDRPTDGAHLAEMLRPFRAPDATAAIADRVAQVPRRSSPTGDASATPAPPPEQDVPRAGATRALPIGGTGPRPPVPGVTPSSGEAAQDAADGDDGDDATGGTRRSRPGAAMGRRLVLAAVAAAAVSVVAIGLNTTDDGNQPADGDDPTGPTAADDTTGEGIPLEVAATGDHDPDGDQQERSDDVDLAVDGDTDTYWPSETYTSTDLGGFDKDGVGIWLELASPAALDRVEVEVSTAGGTVELWASQDGPPGPSQALGDWGSRLGGGEVPGEAMQFPSLPEDEVRTIVLWFTELPAGGNGFRAEVQEVRPYGR